MPDPNVLIGDTEITGTLTVNGVEIGTDVAGLGALYAMAIARMRGAGSGDSGVISATGQATSNDLRIGQADTPAMSIVVQPGVCIVGGVFTGIAGAVTLASVPAPVSNPRIDIVQISQSGVITRKAGAEDASPTAPTPDALNFQLGQVLLAVAMTEIEDADCTDNRTFI